MHLQRWLSVTVSLITLAVLVLGCGGTGNTQTTDLPQDLSLRVLEQPRQISNFELSDTSGQPFNFSETNGNITLLYFGYTYCPDICPMTMYDVSLALKDLENSDRVEVVFVSVDPERDTPQLLTRYLQSFGPDFVGLTDEWDKLQPVMDEFGAVAERQEVSNSAAGYLIDHTASLYLIGPDQHIIGTYPFNFEPENLRSDLEKLMQVWFS